MEQTQQKERERSATALEKEKQAHLGVRADAVCSVYTCRRLIDLSLIAVSLISASLITGASKGAEGELADDGVGAGGGGNAARGCQSRERAAGGAAADRNADRAAGRAGPAADLSEPAAAADLVASSGGLRSHCTAAPPGARAEARSHTRSQAGI